MNYLITGGAGFIGTALANRLAQLGHDVRVVDDLSSSDNSGLSEQVMFYRGDVLNRPKLWTLLQDIDCVYHLAARVSVPESILYPSDYNTVNVGGTVSLLEAIRDVGVRRVVLASSGAVYGVQAGVPLVEDMTPRPLSPYAVSKLSAETYLRTIGTLWGIETVALRIFNTYGPNQPLPASHAPVVARFLQAALRGGSLVVSGDGSQTRDFVYLSDTVEALVAAGESESINRSVINVGSGEEHSILELAQLVIAATGSSSNIIFNGKTSSGVERMQADLNRAQDQLSYRPQVPLHHGLQIMLEADTRFAALRDAAPA